MKANETTLIKAALAYLRACQFAVVWRQNTGAVSASYRGKTRFVRFGVPGVSDIIGCAPDGRFFAAEAKVENNSTTAAQRAFLQAVQDNGGVALAFWTLDDLQAQLAAAGYKVVELA